MASSNQKAKRWATFHLFPSFFLHVQLATEDEELEELPVTHQCNAVTAPPLIPLLEPEQCEDFLRGKATCSKSLQITRDLLHICRYFTLFFRIDVSIHHHVLSTEEPYRVN